MPALFKQVDGVMIGEWEIRIGPWEPYIDVETIALNNADHSIGGVSDQAISNTKEFHKIMHDFPQTEAGSIPLSEKLEISLSSREFNPKIIGLAAGLNPFAAVDAAFSEVAKQSAAGTYDDAEISFDNDGTINDTWTFIFDSATAYKCYGNVTGHVQDGGSDGLTTAVFAPDNGTNVYFTLSASFFTGTWAAGDTLVLKTTPYVAAGESLPGEIGSGGEIKFGNTLAPVFLRCEGIFTFPIGGTFLYLVIPRCQIESSVELSASPTDEAKAPWVISAKDASSAVSGISTTLWNDKKMGRMYWSS